MATANSLGDYIRSSGPFAKITGKAGGGAFDFYRATEPFETNYGPVTTALTITQAATSTASFIKAVGLIRSASSAATVTKQSAVVVNSQQASASTSTAATTQAITPTGIVAGRTLVLLIGNSGGSATGTVTAVSDTGGNTWTLPNPPNGGVSGITNTKMAVAYVHNCVAPGTITATMGNIGGRKLLLLEITGLQNTPADIAGQDTTAATSLTNVAPSVAMTTADFVIALVNRTGTANPTGITAGWTASTAGLPDLTTPILRAGWKEFGASGASGTCTFTFASSQQAGLGTIAFKVATFTGTSIQTNLIRSATTTTTASLVQQVAWIRSATSTVTASYLKAVGKTFSQTVSTVCSRVLQTSPTYSQVITSTPAFISAAAHLRTFAVTASSTPAFLKSVALVRSATTTGTASFSKLTLHQVLASVSLTATPVFVKSIRTTIAVAVIGTPNVVAGALHHLIAAASTTVQATFTVTSFTIFRGLLRKPSGRKTKNTIEDDAIYGQTH